MKLCTAVPEGCGYEDTERALLHCSIGKIFHSVHYLSAAPHVCVCARVGAHVCACMRCVCVCAHLWACVCTHVYTRARGRVCVVSNLNCHVEVNLIFCSCPLFGMFQVVDKLQDALRKYD